MPLLAVGCGKGVAGLLLRPTIGGTEFASKLAGGLSLACLGKQGIVGTVQRRVRPPGAAPLPDEDSLLGLVSDSVIFCFSHFLGMQHGTICSSGCAHRAPRCCPMNICCCARKFILLEVCTLGIFQSSQPVALPEAASCLMRACVSAWRDILQCHSIPKHSCDSPALRCACKHGSVC